MSILDRVIAGYLDVSADDYQDGSGMQKKVRIQVFVARGVRVMNGEYAPFG